MCECKHTYQSKSKRELLTQVVVELAKVAHACSLNHPSAPPATTLYVGPYCCIWTWRVIVETSTEKDEDRIIIRLKYSRYEIQ